MPSLCVTPLSLTVLCALLVTPAAAATKPRRAARASICEDALRDQPAEESDPLVKIGRWFQGNLDAAPPSRSLLLDLVAKAKQGDLQARDRLLAYTYVSLRVAMRRKSRSQFLESIGHFVEQIQKAIENFDPEKVPFYPKDPEGPAPILSYFQRHALRSFKGRSNLTEANHFIRVVKSDAHRKVHRYLDQAETALLSQGLEPTPERLAEYISSVKTASKGALKVRPEDVRYIQDGRRFMLPRSLDEPVGASPSKPLHEFVQSNEESAEAKVAERSLMAWYSQVRKEFVATLLDPQKRLIFSLLYDSDQQLQYTEMRKLIPRREKSPLSDVPLEKPISQQAAMQASKAIESAFLAYLQVARALEILKEESGGSGEPTNAQILETIHRELQPEIMARFSRANFSTRAKPFPMKEVTRNRRLREGFARHDWTEVEALRDEFLGRLPGDTQAAFGLDSSTPDSERSALSFSAYTKLRQKAEKDYAQALQRLFDSPTGDTPH